MTEILEHFQDFDSRLVKKRFTVVKKWLINDELALGAEERFILG